MTNGTDNGAIGLMYEESGIGTERVDGGPDQTESNDSLTFSPLVNKIALGIARELASAVEELENHVDSEARRTVEAIESRLDSLQIELPELSRFAEEQRTANSAMQDQLQQLMSADAELREASTRQALELENFCTEARDFWTAVSGRIDATRAALRDSDDRHAAGLAALQGEMKASFQPVWDRIDSLCRDMGSHHEDISANKASLGTIHSRVDSFVERLDRQADAVRALHSAWSQRDTELEQIVDGLTRLRAYPRPVLASEL